MNNLAKYHLTWICTALLCVSCTITQERTFEQVISARFNSGGKLFGAYRTFYCGSDSDYDYYTCTSFPTRHYKVKTTPHLFYPSRFLSKDGSCVKGTTSQSTEEELSLNPLSNMSDYNNIGTDPDVIIP